MSAGRPVALVTGGCRRLGAAIAARLAAEGYDLALHGASEAEPEPALLAAIAEAGAEARHVVADLADEAAVATLVGKVAALFGRAPAVLVNNASKFGEDRPETVTQCSLLDHYQINCAAPVLLARDLAACAGAGGAVVVNILDQRIASPNGDQFAYTLAKIALAAATDILARELAPNVRVCGVAPGLTLATPDYGDEGMAKAARHMPLERLADPQAVADAVAYLVRAEAVTGQVVYVDAGAHLRHYPRDFLYLD